MLVPVIVILFIVALYLIASGRPAGHWGHRHQLGWMSEQWLAEYRAAHAP